MSTHLPDCDFGPTASWEVLRRRAALLRQVRQFFDERGFLEVETPLLSADTVVDRHLDPFWVDGGPGGPGRAANRYWLQTSPEFGMKRLLAAGAAAIYQICRAFRRQERGPLHNPEFTLVEWYRAGDSLAEGMQLLDDLCQAVLGRGCADRLAYAQAFRQYAGVDPLEADADALRHAAAQWGIAAPGSLAADDRDGWLDLLLAERVQPHLGRSRPVIVYDYPPSQAALAQVRPGPPAVAERFELYVDGLELANGYHELLSAEELRERIRRTNLWRQRDGKEPLPEESRLLRAMEAGLPPCTGCALGFDRLVMVAVGAKTIDEVLAFPFERA